MCVNQDFRCDRPDRIRNGEADISDIWTSAGRLCPAIGGDLYSRRSVGWEVRDRIKKVLAISALHKAIAIGSLAPGLIQPSDRRLQYAGDAYCTRIRAHDIIPSLRGKGHCYDTTMVETLATTIKAEVIRCSAIHRKDAAINAIYAYIAGFDAPVRRHSSLA